MYTDFHTHILPKIDDGAENIETALQILLALRSQDVKRIVFTPHFHIDHISLNDFLIKRKNAFEQVKGLGAVLKDMDLRLAAEVYLVPGISMLQNLEALCIEHTNYLLLELPYKRITAQVMNEIDQICSNRGIHILLAHIDRYLRFNTAQELAELFAYYDVAYQVNTECFRASLRRNAVLELIRYDVPVVLGTDTHNMTTRPPRYDKAVKAIRKRCGLAYLKQILGLADAILSCTVAL